MRFGQLGTIGTLSLLAACAAPPPPPPAPPPPSPMALYEAAIRDAAVKQPADLEARLSPITSKNADVVTWAYDLDSHSVGKLVRTLGADVWITVAPDLKRRCAGLSGAALTLRLQQLLGLPPDDATDRKFFTFTVRSADLFRPCADPRINTSACTLDVPESRHAGLAEATAAAHDRFMLQQLLGSYRVGFDRPGYPFTALGYTYDWKPDSETHHVGLSEFVVRKGAIVRDVQEIDTAAYCAAN
ncbi:hypothetical protein GCM10011611_20870 [Aliidongia dinghuensis]|uniref:Lipoprotein n=1 Tax=Aliidongia dinghuensis TaxID=1867774 RepID=A0A8J3E2Z6_9PROT|nr:hypothetical protein [Aliidongia dinghuensis]GGF14926.1 hypothetical protein GCM10011611_20870 [Aliidongia dinghuensis]